MRTIPVKTRLRIYNEAIKRIENGYNTSGLCLLFSKIAEDFKYKNPNDYYIIGRYYELKEILINRYNCHFTFHGNLPYYINYDNGCRNELGRKLRIEILKKCIEKLNN